MSIVVNSFSDGLSAGESNGISGSSVTSTVFLANDAAKKTTASHRYGSVLGRAWIQGCTALGLNVLSQIFNLCMLHAIKYCFFSRGQIWCGAPTINDFEIIKPISRGAFGKVFLGR